MKKCNGNWKCQYCKGIFPRRIDLIEHKKVCEKGPKLHIQFIIVDGKRKLAPGCTTWNAGHTSEDDPRLKAKSEKLKRRYETGELMPAYLGKKHSEETKKKISESRKLYLSEHPEKVPYVLNHHSKGDSYPEQYFKMVFENNRITYEQNYKIFGYYLDFAWPDKNTYLEIDGEQHYLDKRIIEHDILRTEKLKSEGWICIDRIRWSKYKKLSKEEQEGFISDLVSKINNL